MGLFFPMDDDHLPPGRRKGFARYREIKERQLALQQPKQEKLPEVPKPKAALRGSRTQQSARKQMTICERDMEKLEAAIKALEAELAANACNYEAYSELYAKKEQLDAQLLELMEKWEALAEEAGE